MRVLGQQRNEARDGGTGGCSIKSEQSALVL